MLDTLWWTYKKQWKITMLFMGKSTISMASFHCYVSLPEGRQGASWYAPMERLQAPLPQNVVAGDCRMALVSSGTQGRLGQSRLLSIIFQLNCFFPDYLNSMNHFPVESENFHVFFFSDSLTGMSMTWFPRHQTPSVDLGQVSPVRRSPKRLNLQFPSTKYWCI